MVSFSSPHEGPRHPPIAVSISLPTGEERSVRGILLSSHTRPQFPPGEYEGLIGGAHCTACSNGTACL